MNEPLDIDRMRRKRALKEWINDCRQRMKIRYPSVPFDDNEWRMPREGMSSKIRKVALRPGLADLAQKDASFSDAFRCIAAEVILENCKSIDVALSSFRALAAVEVQDLEYLSLSCLRKLEVAILADVEEGGKASGNALAKLQRISRHVDLLSMKGVIPRFVYTVQNDVKAKLLRITKSQRDKFRLGKASLLDHQIEALSEATAALFNDDPRLTPTDRVAIAAMNLEMCAPSRINEILTLSTDDHVTIDDYIEQSGVYANYSRRSAHQMLIITMKGSKGAKWGAKPILSFMIDLFKLCCQTIVNHGKRSRMLVSWYKSNPDTLYLPPELEHLRGKYIDRRTLWQIVNLRTDDESGEKNSISSIFPELRSMGLTKKIKNPRSTMVNDKATTRNTVESVAWVDLEKHLLAKVQVSIERARWVTKHNFYYGDLSKMLFLHDTDDRPYLVSSLRYASLRRRLTRTAKEIAALESQGQYNWEPTIFMKLGITMPVDGRVQVAWIDTHDPRRWLTTIALSAREKLSDVMINKWASRLSIEQLKHYDLRTAEQRADQSSMPAILELQDFSKGIDSLRAKEERSGLKAEFVAVHDAGISVTSMEAIASAVEQRPIARTSEQLFIIYPSWFGACIHQHHETPCRAYSASCLPCDNNLVVKGHLPTNEAVRARERLLHWSIVGQLEKLVAAKNRGIPDHPEALDEHLLTIVRQGLTPSQMADDLIARFQEIRHLLKDVSFSNKLEEAFVATGMVARLNNPSVAGGALIKYHNPSRHASPGVERCWDARGGREGLERGRERLASEHPVFSPTSVGLSDQRALMRPDDESVDQDADFEIADSEGSYE